MLFDAFARGGIFASVLDDDEPILLPIFAVGCCALAVILRENANACEIFLQIEAEVVHLEPGLIGGVGSGNADVDCGRNGNSEVETHRLQRHIVARAGSALILEVGNVAAGKDSLIAETHGVGAVGGQHVGCQHVTSCRKRDALRKLGRNKTVSIEDMVTDDGIYVSDDIGQKTLSMAIDEALAEIGEPDKEILIRRYYYYQSSTVIGKILGLNSQTVRTKLARAKEKLRKILIERGITL